jgi:hypothetical protein
MSLTQFAVIDGVISPGIVGETLPTSVLLILPARFRVITALKWVNPFITHVWVNLSTTHVWVNSFATHVPVNMSAVHVWLIEFMNCSAAHVRAIEPADPLAAHVWTIECVDYCIALLWLNEIAGPVQTILTGFPVNELTDQVSVIGLVGIAKFVDYSITDDKVQMRELLCLSYCSAMLQERPMFVDSYNMIWMAPTIKYDVVDYPFFVFHPKSCNFLSLGQSLKSYVHHLSQYWLVRVIEFLIHWANHQCYFVSQNMTLLINFDFTPLQHCTKACLTIC